MRVITTDAPVARKTAVELTDAEIIAIEAALHPAIGSYDLWDEFDDLRLELGLESTRAK